MRTALYRHFDGDGELLYVGISLTALGRLSQHMRMSPWAVEVRRVEIDWFDSRRDAEAAERSAIIRERPKHNITHSNSPEERVSVYESDGSRLKSVTDSMVQFVMDMPNPEKTTYYFDANLTGFGVYKTAGGRCSFFVEFRPVPGGNKKRVKIGRANVINARDARRKAEVILAHNRISSPA